MEVRVVAAEVLAKSIRVVLGSLWGGLLVVCGLWLVGGPSGFWPSAAGESGSAFALAARAGVPAWWAGVASVAAGQFVFLAVAADRLCPMNNRRLADVFQTAWTGVFAIGVVGALVTVFGANG